MLPFRFVLLCAALLGTGLLAHAGMTSFTDKGKTDFDTVLKELSPYGNWSQIDGAWAYTPTDHLAPYTSGRWLYTEYGWYWKGNAPHSWVTEHYGYWKRGANKLWSWYPGPYWLPQIVEFRATNSYIGWRCAAVDRNGDFVESPEQRFAKPEEWTFVTLVQFANPITPGVIAKPEVAKAQLDDSTDCRHTYLTYREIDRPGPHPADFFDLSKDGGMLPPRTIQDRLAAQPPPPSAVVPGLTPNVPAPATNVSPSATNAPASTADINPAADTRQVKYWVTMSLPTIATKPPPEAKAEEIYLYRPDFSQDDDGIARRIALWLDPDKGKSNHQTLSEMLNASPSAKPAAGPATSSAPATSTEPPRRHDPFASPFEDTYRPKSAPSKPVPQPSPANGPIPPPTTNAAPGN